MSNRSSSRDQLKHDSNGLDRLRDRRPRFRRVAIDPTKVPVMADRSTQPSDNSFLLTTKDVPDTPGFPHFISGSGLKYREWRNKGHCAVITLPAGTSIKGVLDDLGGRGADEHTSFPWSSNSLGAAMIHYPGISEPIECSLWTTVLAEGETKDLRDEEVGGPESIFLYNVKMKNSPSWVLFRGYKPSECPPGYSVAGPSDVRGSEGRDDAARWTGAI